MAKVDLEMYKTITSDTVALVNISIYLRKNT